jgi:hypothetical protein
MARHRKDYKFYLNNKNSPKYYPNFIKLFNKFGIKNHKIIFIKEYPCQNRKQPEKKKGKYIENDKNCFSKCIVGKTKKKNYDAARKHHLEKNNIKKKTNSITITIKKKIMKKRNAAK